MNAFYCPRIRGNSTYEDAIQLLPSDYTKKVFEAYEEKWTDFIDASMEICTIKMEKPNGPVGYKSFLKYWDSHSQNIRIAKKGSDFCDDCVALRNSIQVVENETLKLELKTVLKTIVILQIKSLHTIQAQKKLRQTTRKEN